MGVRKDSWPLQNNFTSANCIPVPNRLAIRADKREPFVGVRAQMKNACESALAIIMNVYAFFFVDKIELLARNLLQKIPVYFLWR